MTQSYESQRAADRDLENRDIRDQVNRESRDRSAPPASQLTPFEQSVIANAAEVARLEAAAAERQAMMERTRDTRFSTLVDFYLRGEWSYPELLDSIASETGDAATAEAWVESNRPDAIEAADAEIAAMEAAAAEEGRHAWVDGYLSGSMDYPTMVQGLAGNSGWDPTTAEEWIAQNRPEALGPESFQTVNPPVGQPATPPATPPVDEAVDETTERALKSQKLLNDFLDTPGDVTTYNIVLNQLRQINPGWTEEDAKAFVVEDPEVAEHARQGAIRTPITTLEEQGPLPPGVGQGTSPPPAINGDPDFIPRTRDSRFNTLVDFYLTGEWGDYATLISSMGEEVGNESAQLWIEQNRPEVLANTGNGNLGGNDMSMDPAAYQDFIGGANQMDPRYAGYAPNQFQTYRQTALQRLPFGPQARNVAPGLAGQAQQRALGAADLFQLQSALGDFGQFGADGTGFTFGGNNIQSMVQQYVDQALRGTGGIRPQQSVSSFRDYINAAKSAFNGLDPLSGQYQTIADALGFTQSDQSAAAYGPFINQFLTPRLNRLPGPLQTMAGNNLDWRAQQLFTNNPLTEQLSPNAFLDAITRGMV